MIEEIKTYRCACDDCGLSLNIQVLENSPKIPDDWKIISEKLLYWKCAKKDWYKKTIEKEGSFEIVAGIPEFILLKPGDGQAAKPVYSSQDYIEFCEREKAKGLRSDLWNELP